ncbi:AraC family transcriptional regulator [Curtobacterium sp. DN_7.5]|uniref:helix-turn-helix domain-containing protein n=1 Tax=Curtobacterium sp. DN_7.5 TaxID=3049047 RepID=UPI001F5A23D7|nr:AraC family transcriptional regulator [Curtobacterium sp. DN_7.5]
MSTAPPNGFRKARYTHDDGTDYATIFTAEYAGREFATDTFATADTRYEYTMVGDDDLTLRSMRALGGRRGGVIGPRTDHVVFWLTAGELEMHFPDRTRVVRPGTPYIASASEAYRFESSGTVYHGIHIADAFLREVGRQLGFRLPDGPLLFDQQDEAIARREPLRHLIRELQGSLLDDRVTGPMRTALNRRLATVVLDTFPIRNRGEDVPVANRLRDAVRFIEEHAAERPSVTRIAAACGLSERGLQEVFARTMGTTPRRFLRDHRLDRARDELLQADDPSVGMVANHWGFTNPGRFARDYRERFGEDPATTRRDRSNPRVRAAVTFIEQHLDGRLTVASIAEAAGVRPRRLQQLFRAEHGTTPTEFVADLRRRKAATGALADTH